MFWFLLHNRIQEFEMFDVVALYFLKLLFFVGYFFEEGVCFFSSCYLRKDYMVCSFFIECKGIFNEICCDKDESFRVGFFNMLNEEEIVFCFWNC